MGAARALGWFAYAAFLGFLGHWVVTWQLERRVAHPNYPEFSKLLPALPYSLFFVLVHLVFRRLMTPVALAVVQRKARWSSRVYEAKLERFCSASFKFVFFTASTAYMYFRVLRDAPWMPVAMGGSGSTKACWGNGNTGDTMPPIEGDFLWLYQVAMGYHLSEMVFQAVFEGDKPDIVEMMIHHSVTCFLIFSSFYMNFVRIGSLVLFVHDVSDINGYLVKIFVDTKHSVTTFLIYLSLLASWGYFRLYVFPASVIRSVVLESDETHAIGQGAYLFFVFGLSLLLCLHVYWYYKFLQMGWHYLSSGETKDMQANISAMDLKAARKAGILKKD